MNATSRGQRRGEGRAARFGGPAHNDPRSGGRGSGAAPGRIRRPSRRTADKDHDFPAQYAFLPSPLGDILLTATTDGLSAAWLPGHPEYPSAVLAASMSVKNPLTPPTYHLNTARRWFAEYFDTPGEPPQCYVRLNPMGTDFQKLVWGYTAEVEYGTTTSYYELSNAMRAEGLHHSPRHIGGAIKQNRLGIIGGCHRVVGITGRLLDYPGGRSAHYFLLKHEGVR